MEDLSINEAVNVAQQMKNFFKAFKKLDEFIEFIVLNEQGMNEKLKKKVDLEEEIKSLESKVEDLNSSYKNSHEEIKRDLITQREYLEKEKIKLKAKLELFKKSVGEEIEILDSTIKVKRESFEEQTKEVNTEIERLNLEKETANERLREVKSELDKIKSSI